MPLSLNEIRERARAFAHVIRRGKELLGRGLWVIMFPEGTRVPRGEAGTYQASGARLEIEAGVPVVPVAITSARCWPRKALVKIPGVVDVSIGRPIPTAGRKSDELMQEVQAWIEAEMRRLDPDAYPPAPPPSADTPPTHAPTP